MQPRSLAQTVCQRALGKPVGGTGHGPCCLRNAAVDLGTGTAWVSGGRCVCIKVLGDASVLAFVHLVTWASLGSVVLLPNGMLTLSPGHVLDDGGHPAPPDPVS